MGEEWRKERTVGARVRKLRTLRRWSLEHMAREAGLGTGGFAWINKVELGGIKHPGAERLAKLARILGVTVEDLLDGTMPDDLDGGEDVERWWLKLPVQVKQQLRETYEALRRFSQPIAEAEAA